MKKKQYIVIDQSGPSDDFEGCFNSLKDAKDRVQTCVNDKRRQMIHFLIFQINIGDPFNLVNSKYYYYYDDDWVFDDNGYQVPHM
jgi:hypothetical protein